MFATILAVLSMIPLDVHRGRLIFNPEAANWSEPRASRLDGTGFFADFKGYGWLSAYLAYSFLLTWNVIAMEAAACYIGECKDPDRDAKIAMNLEGGYGVFIYTLIPIAFIVVLGAKALSDPALVDPNSIFVTFASKVLPVGGEALNWLIATMLIVALALSALNAIMGSGRALHQMSVDGQFPRWFQHLNHHGVPDRSMFFNVVASLLVVLLGGAVEIYTFSNVGYTGSFLPVLVGYFLLRRTSRAPAVPAAGVHEVRGAGPGPSTRIVWLYGGLVYSKLGNAQIYFYLGWLVLLSYLPFYWYRTRVEDPRVASWRAGRSSPPGPARRSENDPHRGAARAAPAPMLWTRPPEPPDPATPLPGVFSSPRRGGGFLPKPWTSRPAWPARPPRRSTCFPSRASGARRSDFPIPTSTPRDRSGTSNTTWSGRRCGCSRAEVCRSPAR
jgi:amino acid transporter